VLARHESAASFSAQVETPRQDRISQLENEVAQLRSQVESLTAQFQEFRKQFD
jgi:flagellar biosynthesis chaperone FliJ